MMDPFLEQGLPPGTISPPGGHWPMSGDTLGLSCLAGRGRYWLLVGGGQGCHPTSCHAQDRPRNEESPGPNRLPPDAEEP